VLRIRIRKRPFFFDLLDTDPDQKGLYNFFAKMRRSKAGSVDPKLFCRAG
jgi:hypothetical protein